MTSPNKFLWAVVVFFCITAIIFYRVDSPIDSTTKMIAMIILAFMYAMVNSIEINKLKDKLDNLSISTWHIGNEEKVRTK